VIRRRLIGLLIAGLAIGVAAGRAHAEPARFSLEVSPSDGSLDDTFVATVHIEVMGVAGPERYSHPKFPGFKVLDTRLSTTTSMVFDPARGQELRTTEVRRYFLRAKSIGRQTVGPATLRLDGEEFETKQATVTVRSVGSSGVAAPQYSSDPTAAGGIGVPGYSKPKVRPGEDMFLHVAVDKTSAYVGEQVTVTWLLFTRSEVLGLEPRAPAFDDFWFEKLFEPRRRLRYHDTRLGRVPYLVTIVSKRAVFPNREGLLEIPPFEAKVSNMTTPRGRSESLRSAPVKIRAKPLPDGAPPGFDPTYVGVYSVDASLDRARVEAGESLTMTVTVRGQGAIRRTSPPIIDIEGFKITGPRDDDPKVDTSGENVRGERTYRYWVQPEQGGELEVPPIVIPYFDPGTSLYHAAQSDALAIVVSGDPNARDEPQSAGGLRENVIKRDVRPARGGQSIDSRAVPFLYRSRWFWILALVPFGVFLSVVMGDKLRERMRKETPRSRLRKARGRARGRFRVAELHLRGARAGDFYGELTRILYEHLEDRVGEPVQSMTLEQLREYLTDRAFPKPTVQRIVRELEAFDFARFTPAAAEQEEMKAAQRRVRELLREIERVRPEQEAA
jgi:hypothetical protein